jgi:Cysteine-rich CWC
VAGTASESHACTRRIDAIREMDWKTVGKEAMSVVPEPGGAGSFRLQASYGAWRTRTSVLSGDRMTGAPFDGRHCPLCGSVNDCAIAEGALVCWCFSARFAKGVMDRVPEAAEGVACVCRGCASGRRQPGEVEAGDREDPSRSGAEAFPLGGDPKGCRARARRGVSSADRSQGSARATARPLASSSSSAPRNPPPDRGRSCPG